jgi:hypothetical protein
MYRADKMQSCLMIQQVFGLLETVNDGTKRLSQHTKSCVTLVYYISTPLHERHDQHA